MRKKIAIFLYTELEDENRAYKTLMSWGRKKSRVLAMLINKYEAEGNALVEVTKRGSHTCDNVAPATVSQTFSSAVATDTQPKPAMDSSTMGTPFTSKTVGNADITMGEPSSLLNEQTEKRQETHLSVREDPEEKQQTEQISQSNGMSEPVKRNNALILKGLQSFH